MKIVTIIGTRPQFIKAAPVSLALQNSEINEIIVNTGQHYDYNMSDIFINDLNIPKPKYNLSVGSHTHGKQISKIICKLEDIILHQEVKIVPKNNINGPNLDKIIESANIAMDKFNKRMNRES